MEHPIEVEIILEYVLTKWRKVFHPIFFINLTGKLVLSIGATLRNHVHEFRENIFAYKE